MTASLTTPDFWKKYWHSKKIIIKVKKNYPFNDLFSKIIKPSYKSFIEIGGFPGYFAIYAKKYLRLDSTLVDYFIHQPTINKLLKFNDLKKEDITILKKNIFSLKAKKKYDLVFSSGLIEHFDNFDTVIKKHWQLTKKDGTMFIVLPNFLGLNGVLQLLVDPEMLAIHNLLSMDIKRLNKIVKNLKPKQSRISYYGGLGIWLENLTNRPLFLKLLVYTVVGLGRLVKLTGFNSKFTSPFIYIWVEKK